MEKTIMCSSCQVPLEVVGPVEEPSEIPEASISVACIECGALNSLEWPIGKKYLVRRAE
jgi:hypothetical protein